MGKRGRGRAALSCFSLREKLARVSVTDEGEPQFVVVLPHPTR
jgi:hypothetical protein